VVSKSTVTGIAVKAILTLTHRRPWSSRNESKECQGCECYQDTRIPNEEGSDDERWKFAGIAQASDDHG
jgi:hypothetical protein